MLVDGRGRRRGSGSWWLQDACEVAGLPAVGASRSGRVKWGGGVVAAVGAGRRIRQSWPKWSWGLTCVFRLRVMRVDVDAGGGAVEDEGRVVEDATSRIQRNQGQTHGFSTMLS